MTVSSISEMNLESAKKLTLNIEIKNTFYKVKPWIKITLFESERENIGR